METHTFSDRYFFHAKEQKIYDMSKNEEKQLKTLQAVREGIKTRIFSFISSLTASSSFILSVVCLIATDSAASFLVKV